MPLTIQQRRALTARWYGRGSSSSPISPSAGDVLTLDSNLVPEWAAPSGGGGGLTAEQCRDTIGTALVAGTGATITVNDGADTITIAADPEYIRDTVSAALVAGTGVSISVNDGADTITLTATGLTQPQVMARGLGA